MYWNGKHSFLAIWRLGSLRSSCWSVNPGFGDNSLLSCRQSQSPVCSHGREGESWLLSPSCMTSAETVYTLPPKALIPKAIAQGIGVNIGFWRHTKIYILFPNNSCPYNAKYLPSILIVPMVVTCSSFHSEAHHLICSFIWKTEQDIPIIVSLSKSRQQLELGQATAGSQELSPDLPRGWQGPNCLNHYLLLSKVCISK